MEILQSLLGMAIIIAFCTLISQDRKRIPWRLVAWGVGLRFAFGLLILKTGPGLKVFEFAENVFAKLYDFTGIGVEFLAGKTLSEMNTALCIGSVLIFVASLMAVLYYLRVIQPFVYVFSKLMQYTDEDLRRRGPCFGIFRVHGHRNRYGNKEIPRADDEVGAFHCNDGVLGMLDFFLSKVGTSLRELSSYLFAPVAWLAGVTWKDCLEVGRLLGIKVIFNEFISYQKMQQMAQAGELNPRSVIIATYALCSFANFGSLAILIRGIGGLAP